MNENVTTIIGNVATETRVSTTRSGASIATFRVASTSRRFDKSRQMWSDGDTNWFTVVCFRQLADNVILSVAKGEPVVVHGRLKQRPWTKDGRQGVANELEAYAVGHDLNKGVSQFVRPVRSEPAEPEPVDAVAELMESWIDDDLEAEITAALHPEGNGTDADEDAEENAKEDVVSVTAASGS